MLEKWVSFLAFWGNFKGTLKMAVKRTRRQVGSFFNCGYSVVILNLRNLEKLNKNAEEWSQFLDVSNFSFFNCHSGQFKKIGISLYIYIYTYITSLVLCQKN